MHIRNLTIGVAAALALVPAGNALAATIQGGAPTGGRDDREAFELEARGDGATYGRVVVDQQNERTRGRVTHV